MGRGSRGQAAGRGTMKRLLWLAMGAAVALADAHDQLAFSVPQRRPRKRVAIIGGGAAGSSAAYWLREEMDQRGQDLDMTLFEKEEIGGRSTTVDIYNGLHGGEVFKKFIPPVELGASLFVAANRHLIEFSKEFNFTLVDHPATPRDLGWTDQDDSRKEPKMGIWSGKRWVYYQSGGWGIWDNFKLIYRYGFAPMKALSIVKEVVDGFSRIYEFDWKNESFRSEPFESINHLSSFLGLDSLARTDTETYLYSQRGVSDLFVSEFVDGVSRVNYVQDVNRIHAVGGLVSMAPTVSKPDPSEKLGTLQKIKSLFVTPQWINTASQICPSGSCTVLGGNRHLFEKLVKFSRATVQQGRNAQVSGLLKRGPNDWTLFARGQVYDHFDAIILAAPFESAGLTILGSHASIDFEARPTQFVEMYVTVLTTTAERPSVKYFGTGSGDMPDTILTTSEDLRKSKGRNDLNMQFHALSYLFAIPQNLTKSGQTEWAVKIFSRGKLTPDTLSALFDADIVDESATLWPWPGKGSQRRDQITWIFQKSWYSYPELVPRETYQPLIADKDGLYYINAMEAFISTMETQTIAAREVVRNIISSWSKSL